MNEYFRVYTSYDIIGVELAAALKNVVALSCGICSGLGFQDNTKALLITRAMAELTRLGEQLGGTRRTFGGLAGIGDLIVTATSMHSRNNRCGMLIGQGVPVEEAKKQVGMVVEGINALPAAMVLKKKYDVEMPIVEAAYAVVFQGIPAKNVVQQLMGRDKKPELPPAAWDNQY